MKREPDFEFEPVTPIWTVPVLASFLSSLCVSSHEAADMTAVAPNEHKMCQKYVIEAAKIKGTGQMLPRDTSSVAS